MGYMVNELTLESLLSFAMEEYSHVSWTTFSESSEEHLAIWGWTNNGTYTVALALKVERSVEEAEELTNFYKDVLKDADYKVLASSWLVKFINESEGPVIQPPQELLKFRPFLTKEGAKSLKECQECMKVTEYWERVREDEAGVGAILAAVKVDNERTFIWTTNGNYYMPSSAYDTSRAMAGILTVESLEESGILLVLTDEEQPNYSFEKIEERSSVIENKKSLDLRDIVKDGEKQGKTPYESLKDAGFIKGIDELFPDK